MSNFQDGGHVNAHAASPRRLQYSVRQFLIYNTFLISYLLCP